MARAPYDVRTPRRARGVCVQRGSLSPLCDTSFAEAVAPAPGAGADDLREGHEGTETPGFSARHQLQCFSARHQLQCFSARTFIDSVNNVRVALQPASESHHGSNEATSRSRSERNRAHARSSTSAHLQPWAWRAAIDHFSPPTPLTSLKVSEYHVKRICTASIHPARRETLG